MVVWLIAGAVVLGAPLPKDGKKEPPSLVGAWETVSANSAGTIHQYPAGELGFEFAADGTVVIRQKDKSKSTTYSVDNKKEPPEIDLTPADGVKQPTSIGIFRVDGDTLMICFDQTPGAARPRSFEAPEGSSILILTLKRVKPKK